ncbi:DUF4838 domain-containing protein [Roseimicrobium sp. ORNL1]|uniref:DUF4838 domain-containing protein n=1 Tax=Roseimicrobium sp. ORNL1 TaxID=2711231 RepID=UPI0013E1F0C9|nr:DUF4838 domain-containing protein [Roseimicrobium sp. ORNL1]QIF03528.1 DUF4838 domain-containing protein [Roseimicrobium sp. ORNL1]
MKRVLLSLLLLCSASLPPWSPSFAASAPGMLVENGQPRSEIVVAENAMRPVRLAAQELQDHLKKITGAHVPIVTTPSPSSSQAQVMKIFVGRSTHTDKLKVSADGLKDGAYRMVSGDGWLALIGEDTEFTPIAPFAKSNAEIASGKLQSEWDAITGELWGVPHPGLYKNRLRLPGTTGLPDALRATPIASAPNAAPMELWGYDERGSYNAVCGYLMGLGVRWYMPGEVGEVIPTLKSLPLPKVNETVIPDFPMRRFNVKLGVFGEDMAKWAMRLGLRDPYGIQVAHGLDDMTHRKEIFEKYPEWFALYGGKRHTAPDQRLNQLCYSNEELLQHTVRYVRAQLDHYKLDAISVMPPDGFSAMCQCDKCKGKDTPERGPQGLLSDYVWDFVNRVAKEVRKSHPDKKVMNCAYGAYTLPPLKIEKLEPNVVVSIVGGRRPANNRPDEQAAIKELRESWLPKISNPLINFENYPLTERGWYLPAYTPHVMGESINAIKDTFQGEDIWLSMRQDFEKTDPGFNHFLVYFTQRMYWGGPKQDVDAMFREYVRLFYGPAEQEMLAFFGYCENNWQDMEKDKAKADHALALFATAKAKAEPASIHGRRLALVDAYLNGLRNKSEQLGKKRGPVPVFRLVGEGRGKIVVDGKLDEEPWAKVFPSATCRLRELQTGRLPTFGTTVKGTLMGNDLYLAFICEEEPGTKPQIGTSRKDDAALWYGDCVEVLLETNSHSYYQIAVSPSGAVVDLDRSAPRNAWLSWDSQAEVATSMADGHWIVEMRIPLTDDENDPLHQVIGQKPTKSLPWFVNFCRQRVREDGQEHSAFSPTGADHFHNAMKFAHFYNGNSFDFDAAEPDADFLTAMRKAADLDTSKTREQAVDAYVKASEGKLSPLQKSHALESAAIAAGQLRKYDMADQIAATIPVEAVKKSVRMRNLLNQAKAPQVVAEYASEDITKWPFWKRGDGYYTRGRAYAITKQAKEAEADLTSALPWIADRRVRDATLLAQGQNRETNLKDADGALKAYHTIVDGVAQIGSSDQYGALHGIARIHTQRGEFDAALKALNTINLDKAPGILRTTTLLAIGDTRLAAGKKAEALAAYKTVAEDKTTEPRFKKTAEEKIAGLK